MRKLPMYLLYLCTITLLMNCGKDDDQTMEDETPVETTVAEDKANVEQSMEDVISCTEDIKDGRSFTEAFDNFLNLSEGESLNQEWIDNLSEGLEEVIDFERIEESSTFELEYHAGTHTYDISTGSWSKTNDVTDRVVLNFPTSPDANANNAEFIIDSFNDQAVTIDGETMSLPNSMHLLLNIDNAKAVEFTLSNVTYADNSAFQIPVEVSASLFVDPMNLNIEVSRMSSTSFDANMSFDNDNICDVELASQFELKNDDYENLDNSSFEKVDVQVNLGQMSFKTMGNLASLLAMDDPTDEEVNALTDLDLFFSDMKIGDVEINDEMETIVVLYKDSSTEDLNEYVERIEDILSDFF